MSYPFLNDALQAVKSLAFQRVPLNLVSTYKGVHFIERIQPIKIGVDSITFRAPRLQVCVTLRDPVYLYSRVLPETVRAKPQLLNTSPQELRLSDFSFNGNLWFDRMEQRVQPDRPIEVMLKLHNRIYSATLRDISLHGAGLLLYTGDQPNFDVLVNTPVDLRFDLTPTTSLDLHAKVVCRRRVGSTMMVLGVRIFPSEEQTRWLENYIVRRKLEILNELDELINQEMEPQTAADLYF